MDETQEIIWDTIADLDVETVLRLFTNFYGLQLLNEKFKGFLEEEGFLESDEEEDEDDE